MFGGFILKKLSGKKGTQWVFEKLHFISLYGMNIGGGSDYRNSGEAWLLGDLIGKTNGTFKMVDVGANSGGYTHMALEIAKAKGVKLESILIEPNPDHAYALNKLSSTYEGITWDGFALGSTSAEGILKVSEIDTLSSLLNNQVLYENAPMVRTVPISICTLDQLMANKGWGQIDLLKIDVEGYEMEVLKGALSWLRLGKIKVVQFEFGRAQILSQTFLYNFFEILGNYSLFRLLKDGLSGPLKYSPRLEIFQTTNFVAFVNESTT